jgi:hypothetical protein
MDTEVITTLIGSLGAAGALVWYMYYNTTSTIPGIIKQYTESQERTSANFANTQEKIATHFTETLKEERDYRRQEIQALQSWIKSEASCKYNSDRK